ncbi:MAG: type VI secretion system tube protein Hcp [Polyangiales bacterium]
MAVDMFLKIDDIKGESTDEKHKGLIEVLSWSWGMSQTGSSHVGTGAGTGKVDVQNLTITKYIDTATPNLVKLCCKGKAFTAATLYIRKAGDKPVEYVKLELHNGLISQVAVAGSGGDDRFTENVSLNFASFKYIYTPQDAKGAAGAEISAAWNIAKNSETVP